MKISRAYSLIELSVVILIIGVLIAGIKAGTELLVKSRLKTARALTNSSYAASVEDMILWLDATSATSVTNDSSATIPAQGYVVGGTQHLVYNWDDQNPQLQVRLRFTQSTSGYRPTYVEKGINNLPTLFFDAAADASTGNEIYAAYSVTLNPAAFTLFIVTSPMQDTSASGYIIENRNGSTGFASKAIDTSNVFQFVSYSVNSGPSDAAVFNFSTAYISTVSTTGATHTLYRNGAYQNVASSAISPNTSTVFRLGCSGDGTGNCYDGYISEIIMYSRALETEERKEIEKYLGKKYGILVQS